MDATKAISTLAETDTVNTPTWALLTGLGGILVSVAMSAFAMVFSRKEKSDERVVAMAAEIANLREQAVLAEVKSIGQRMDAAHAEMRSEMRVALASIQASMERHDTAIEEMRRQVTALMEWKIGVEAKMNKGGVGAA